MDAFLNSLYDTVSLQEYSQAKALANFMFREIIEDIHNKYNITQEDIKQMCKEAVNRANVYLELQKDEIMSKGFIIEAVAGLEWDNPELTSELKDKLKLYKEIGETV